MELRIPLGDDLAPVLSNFGLDLLALWPVQADHRFSFNIRTELAVELEDRRHIVTLEENMVQVWREYRGLTHAELAAQCGLAQATIAQIEGGKRTGSVEVLKKIAEALTLDLDDLV